MRPRSVPSHKISAGFDADTTCALLVVPELAGKQWQAVKQFEPTFLVLKQDLARPNPLIKHNSKLRGL
jgi:hypothetical protein